MDWEQFYQCVRHTISNVSSWSLIKVSAAVAAITANAAFNMHVQLLLLFALLIGIDLFTKWISLGHKYLVQVNAVDRCFMSSMLAIGKARKAKLISSTEMKHRFLGKIIIYLLVIIIAAITDAMLGLVKRDLSFVEFAVWYLAVSELISIVENLNDANVEIAEKFIRLIKVKVGFKE